MKQKTGVLCRLLSTALLAAVMTGCGSSENGAEGSAASQTQAETRESGQETSRASQEGKCLTHTAGESHTSTRGGEQDPFTESMAEAGKSAVDALDGNILYKPSVHRL